MATAPAIDVEEWYQKYGYLVYKRCLFLLKNEEQARDAMQDTFAKVLVNRPRLKGTYPSALLYRIATTTCLDVLRSARVKRERAGTEMLERIADLDSSEEQVETRLFLDRIFQREKPSTREIAVMHYVDRMTLEEVARASGMSVSGVRKRLRVLRSRALDLKGELEWNDQ